MPSNPERRMFPSRVSALIPLLVALGSGCSGSSDQTSPPVVPPPGDCSSDPSGTAFHVGMSVTGRDGHVVELLEATPTEPTQDSVGNRWKVKIADANGSVDGMTVTALCNMTMPGGGASHGCGGGAPPVKSLGNGEYQVSPIYFNMPGDWELIFTIKDSDSANADTARIAACVPR
jgi:hypothetical protein